MQCVLSQADGNQIDAEKMLRFVVIVFFAGLK